jgi:hypothetical protein
MTFTFARNVPRGDRHEMRDLASQRGVAAQSLRHRRGASCKRVRCALSAIAAQDDVRSRSP